MTGNIRSWIHYLQLRGSESTQEEHRILAEQISVIFKEQFPAIEQALNVQDI
jgi:thymidylate synthase (FAD)